jgi:hypothetical protein
MDDGDAGAARIRRARQAQRPPIHDDLAAIRPVRVHPGQDLDERRFPGASLAAKPDDFAGSRRQMGAAKRVTSRQALLDTYEL